VHLYATSTDGASEKLSVVASELTIAVPLTRWLAERAGRTTLFDARELPMQQLRVERPIAVLHLLRERDLA
jgi:hypothetical protein